MTIRHIRDKLAPIPGALMDIPPGEERAGDMPGVIGQVLNDPDVEEERFGNPGDAYRSMDVGDEEADDGNFEPVLEWGPDSEEAMRRLGNATDEVIRQSVQVHSGPDALGHYLSFHFRGAQWGATVKASGVAWLATRYFGGLSVDSASRARLAFHAILQHELFHFATDVAIAQAELSQRQAWYLPGGTARQNAGHSYSLREEMLANVWMLRAFRTALPGFRVRGKQAALKAFVELQPPGYRDALGLEAGRWNEELHHLAYEYAEWAGEADTNPMLWGWGYEWPSHFPIRPRIDWRRCAIHYENDSERFGVPSEWLTFLTRLSVIDESEKFSKQLAKLESRYRQRWEATKMRAMTSLTAGQDFKPWRKGGKDVWSMRIDDAFRVHLRRDRQADRWVALEVGDHKSMGHG